MKVGDLVRYKDFGPIGIVTKVWIHPHLSTPESTRYQVYELDGDHEGMLHWWADTDGSKWEVISENR
jgi:hypothetical protein